MQASTPNDLPRQWLPETPEGELAAAFFRLMRQFRAMRGADPAMAVLGTIMRAGPLRITSLAEQLKLDISTTSRHVRQLERAGWLTRERDPADQRATLLTVTPDGTEHLRQGMQRRMQAMHAATTAWSPTDVHTLTTLINRLADDLGEVVEPGAHP